MVALPGPLQLTGSLLPSLLVVAGLVLAIAEALLPGTHFIVLGLALLGAGLVGLVLGSVAPGLVSPFLLGLLVLVFGGLSFYAYREFSLSGGRSVAKTRDSASLKGKTGRVTERVTPTGGEVKLDAGGFNPYYAARSIDGEIPEGDEVMVIDPGGGNVLTVESLSAVEDPIDRELAKGRREAERTDREPKRAERGDRESEREADRDGTASN